MHNLSQSTYDACDTIDAAIFSGDEFLPKEARESLREWMARWERELKRYDDFDKATS